MSIKITMHHLKVIHYQTFIHNLPLSNSHCISILRLRTDTSTRTTMPQKEAVKDFPPPNLTEMTLMMSMGVIFAMIVVFLRLENGSKMRSVFLRNDIGMSSEFSSAKMERVLASLRVQSYNTKKRIPNFLQICGISEC